MPNKKTPPTQEAEADTTLPMGDTPSTVSEQLASVQSTAADLKPNDLEQLRKILYGSQARSTEKQLKHLETEIVSLRQDLLSVINEKVSALADTSSMQVTAVRQDLSAQFNQQKNNQSAQLRQIEQKLASRIETQTTEQTTQLRSVRRDLTERLENQESDQSTKARSLQQEFTKHIEAITADFLTQLRDTHKELSDQLDQLRVEKTERMQTLRTETWQRDDTLRQELRDTTAALEYKKASRHQLAQLLVELGQRLDNESEEHSSQ